MTCYIAIVIFEPRQRLNAFISNTDVLVDASISEQLTFHVDAIKKLFSFALLCFFTT